MTDLLVTGVRLALYADLMLLMGLAAFLLYGFGKEERGNPQLVTILSRPLPWLCFVGLLASAAGIVVLTATMQGVGLLSVDLAMLLSVIHETDVGIAWFGRMTALFIAAGVVLHLARRPRTVATILTVAGSFALITLTWSGHAGASEGVTGVIHRVSDALHMVAAAIWLGAIAAFLLLLRSQYGTLPSTQIALTARALDRFSRVGTACVLVIAATGLINAELIFGIENAGRLVASPYGQLLFAKLVLFGSMLVLAAANRWRLTPALAMSLVDGDSHAAIQAIRRSLATEALAGMLILALVGWLGTLEPLPVAAAT